MKSLVKCLEFENAQLAWEGINKYILNNETEIEERGGGRYGPIMSSYNMFIKARELWVDPEFDLGLVFGYQKHKWSSLCNNYIDLDQLDIVKTQIQDREKKYSQSYNISYIFSNSHVSGKGCLLTLTFQRRINTAYPILVLNLRASEVTKRLIFDFVLIQRIFEYVYGPGKHASLEMFCGNCYLSAEHFTMYDGVEPIESIIQLNADGKMSTYQKRVLNRLEFFKQASPKEITYKSHLRAVKQLQKDKSISGIKSMKVGSLQIV